MKLKAWITGAIAAAAAVFQCGAQAGELSNFSTLSQGEFQSLSKDLAAATSSKSIEPAAPLGIVGFDVSASTAVTQTQAGSAWNKTSGGSVSQLVTTKLSVSKGLPGGVDVGAFWAQVPANNVSVLGLHAKYALLDGSALSPALAVRGHYSRLSGVSQLDLSNTGADILISKGFLGLTPYAGVGVVYTQAQPNGVANLSGESLTLGKTFAGVSWNLLLLNLSAEYDRTGEATTYALKAGLRF